MLPSRFTLEEALLDILLLFVIFGAEIEVEFCSDCENQPTFVKRPVRAFYGNHSILGFRNRNNEAL